MAKRSQDPCPMVRALRGLQSDDADGKICEEIRELPSSQALPKCDLPAGIYSMNLKYILRCIETNDTRCWHSSPSPDTLPNTDIRAESIPSGQKLQTMLPNCLCSQMRHWKCLNALQERFRVAFLVHNGAFTFDSGNCRSPSSQSSNSHASPRSIASELNEENIEKSAHIRKVVHAPRENHYLYTPSAPFGVQPNYA